MVDKSVRADSIADSLGEAIATFGPTQGCNPPALPPLRNPSPTPSAADGGGGTEAESKNWVVDPVVKEVGAEEEDAAPREPMAPETKEEEDADPP